MPEVRRLMEGRRVDAEIEAELQRAGQAVGPDGDLDQALGKTTPRESDRAKLREFDQQLTQQQQR